MKITKYEFGKRNDYHPLISDYISDLTWDIEIKCNMYGEIIKLYLYENYL